MGNVAIVVLIMKWRYAIGVELYLAMTVAEISYVMSAGRSLKEVKIFIEKYKEKKFIWLRKNTYIRDWLGLIF